MVPYIPSIEILLSKKDISVFDIIDVLTIGTVHLLEIILPYLLSMLIIAAVEFGYEVNNLVFASKYFSIVP